jgi:hypothetical protein
VKNEQGYTIGQKMEMYRGRHVLSGLGQDDVLGTALCILSPPHKGVLVPLPVGRGEDLCHGKDSGDVSEVHSVRCMQRQLNGLVNVCEQELLRSWKIGMSSRAW